MKSFALIVALLAPATALGQSMPDYRPAPPITATLRIAGDDHQKAMLAAWEHDFHTYQPNIVFHDNLTSTVHGIPALVFNLADLALLGREIAPLENLAFLRAFRYDPLEITTATGSFDIQYQAYALGIFVNRVNPLTRLTLQQAAAIFGCRPGSNLRTWGQLGLTGYWSNKPIHVFGYPTGNNIATFFELKVLRAPAAGGPTLPNSARWNCALREYSNTYDANDKPVISSDEFMMRDLGRDKYAIAYSGIAALTPRVKPLALAIGPGAPYVPFTRATVADRTYPLTRSIYVYLNAPPGKPLPPAVDEFLRFVLSRQGQLSIRRQDVFLPLDAATVQQNLHKLPAQNQWLHSSDR